jgi:uncharacterized protein YndB with AHSA1/START domain
MATNKRTMKAPAEVVWEVLSDGWLYPLWVVGASRMRDVDRTWPEVGSQLHHSVGAWPLLLDDSTEVLRMASGSMLTLHARGWPAGAARVTITLEAQGEETVVVMQEDVAGGPAVLVPRPLRELPITWRNVESLRRLAYVVERRPTR